jgi:hypothetical protein
MSCATLARATRRPLDSSCFSIFTGEHGRVDGLHACAPATQRRPVIVFDGLARAREGKGLFVKRRRYMCMSACTKDGLMFVHAGARSQPFGLYVSKSNIYASSPVGNKSSD